MVKQNAWDARKEYMKKRKELFDFIEPYLDDTDEGIDEWGVSKIKDDAPQKIKETYDEYLRLIHVGTSEDRKMLGTWFQTIKPYGVFKGRALAGIREDAPSEAKDAYEKLKRSRIRVWESGAVVK